MRAQEVWGRGSGSSRPQCWKLGAASPALMRNLPPCCTCQEGRRPARETELPRLEHAAVTVLEIHVALSLFALMQSIVGCVVER